MPWIVVSADDRTAPASSELLRERISCTDLESEHFTAQLVERLGWAVVDADEREQQGGAGEGEQETTEFEEVAPRRFERRPRRGPATPRRAPVGV